MPWTPQPLPDLTTAPTSVRPYLEDLAETYTQLVDMSGNRGKHLGKPVAGQAADHLTAAAQVARRFDKDGAAILTDHAKQLRRANSTSAAYDVFVEAVATLAGIIRAATITTPQ